jgi:hypothetical protein
MPRRTDRTATICATIVFVAALNLGGKLVAPNATPPSNYLSWWDISCWLMPSADWCPRPVPDPVLPPDCDIYGPCQ